MNIFENFRTALKSLWNNRLRSFLTLLGIVIGVYAVVTLLAAAQGVQNQIGGFVEDFGPRTILVMPGESDASGTPNFAAQAAPSTLVVDDIDYLKAHTTLIESVIDYAVFIGGLATHGDKKLTGMPVGITPGAVELFSIKVVNGRDFTQSDLDQKKRLIVISEVAAEKLAVKVGETMNIGVNQFEVIGLFKLEQSLTISSAQGEMFFIPAPVANEINKSPQINRIVAHAKTVEDVDQAITEVREALTVKHGTTDFTVMKPSDILKTVDQIINVLKYMVIGITSISLLVGGIGIMNIMLVTVAERTREIGIRKAVGATEGAILTQFLIESVLLTLFGALIGISLAALTSYLAARFSPLEPVITGSTIMMAVGMGVVAGVIFGLLPALRAARKNPVQALKYE
ncbi:MAG: ABC transporter permease [bacterium]|nr:ABC transporter permease [bacterium]